jgi:tellurite resistance protein TerC
VDDVPGWLWGGFSVALLAMLVIDFFAHRGHRAESRQAAIVWTVIWIGAGLAFGAVVWAIAGGVAGRDYYGVYVLEKSLSIDNLFVFLLIFKSLKIPEQLQRKALLYGIVGALVFRAVFIFAGAAAIERWGWLEFVFAAVLAWSAWRVFLQDPADQEDTPVLRLLEKWLPITRELHDGRLIAMEKGKRMVTPILVAILGLELTDIMFAIDSVPAAFAITHDPFVIYTANAFAILGLRSLYIVLAHSLSKFEYLHYGLAVVLLFAAVKIGLSRWFHIPTWLSITIILLAVGGSLIPTFRARHRPAVIGPKEPTPAPEDPDAWPRD